MITEKPKFVDSPYFVAEPGNWHLKPGAPADVVKEFEDFQGLANKEGFVDPPRGFRPRQPTDKDIERALKEAQRRR